MFVKISVAVCLLAVAVSGDVGESRGYLPPPTPGYNYPPPKQNFPSPPPPPPPTQPPYRPPPTQPPYRPPNTYGPPPPQPRPTPPPRQPTVTYGPPTSSSNNNPSRTPGPGEPGHVHIPGTPYDFKYAVKDDHYGTDFSHNAVSDGDQVKGEWRVLMPDGRTQIVTYIADWATGFHPQIRYEGEIKPYVPQASNQQANTANAGYRY